MEAMVRLGTVVNAARENTSVPVEVGPSPAYPADLATSNPATEPLCPTFIDLL